MAPDLNFLGPDGKMDYSQPGSSGYDIPKITYNVSRRNYIPREIDLT
jgi:hypothetical protein